MKGEKASKLGNRQGERECVNNGGGYVQGYMI